MTSHKGSVVALTALRFWTGSLHHESSMNVWDDTTTSDGSFDKSVKLFITSNSKLQMSWGDSLDLKILGCVTSKLKNLSSQILEDGCTVDSGSSSNSAVGTDSILQNSMNSSDWELLKSK